MGKSAEGMGFVTGGAATGAWVSLNLGNMGLAFSGTAVSLGFTPLTMAGGITGAATYGLFRATVEGDPAALTAATLGGLGGAGLSVTVGNMGLAFSGTAISLGFTPVTLAGGVVGLALYGLVKILDSGSREAFSDVIDRMAAKIADQDCYQQALLELNLAALEQALMGDAVEQQFRRWEVDAELEALKAELYRDGMTIEAQFIPRLAADFTPPATLATPAEQNWQCRQRLNAHAGAVHALVVSCDSQTLITGGEDRTIRYWDLTTGEFLHRLSLEREVYTLAIDPGQQRLVGGGGDRKVTAWNFQTRQLLHTFSHLNSAYSHQAAVRCLAFHSAGNLLISGGEDGVLRVWQADKRGSVQTLNGHRGAVLALAFHPDGHTLYSSGVDRTIRIWQTQSWSSDRSLAEHADSICSLAISPGGEMLVSGSLDGTIKVWNLSSEELVWTCPAHAHGRLSLAISSDGALLASGSNDGTVKLWCLTTGALRQTLEGNDPVTFSPNGQVLITGGSQGWLKIWYRPGFAPDCGSPPNHGSLGTWWHILGVRPNATFTIIKQAYQQLAKQYHPDLNRSPDAAVVMQILNQAFAEAKQNHYQQSAGL